MDSHDGLSGPEIVLLIEALDALIPFREDTAHGYSDQERERWLPYSLLRGRLKDQIHMSFYDAARGWLDAELARERLALSDKLFSSLCELMRVPGATPRSVRDGYTATMRELREVRQSTPRPLS